jgi:hypothetical protein
MINQLLTIAVNFITYLSSINPVLPFILAVLFFLFFLLSVIKPSGKIKNNENHIVKWG